MEIFSFIWTKFSDPNKNWTFKEIKNPNPQTNIVIHILLEGDSRWLLFRQLASNHLSWNYIPISLWGKTSFLTTHSICLVRFTCTRSGFNHSDWSLGTYLSYHHQTYTTSLLLQILEQKVVFSFGLKPESMLGAITTAAMVLLYKARD